MRKHELIVRAIITQDDCLIVNRGTHHQTGQFYYALPGGHVEVGESCKEALQRELLEELAVECSVDDLCFVIEHLYAGRHEEDAPRHELTLYFKVTMHSIILGTGAKIISPEATKNFCWLPIDSIKEAALLPKISSDYLQKYFSNQKASLYAYQDSTSENSH